MPGDHARCCLAPRPTVSKDSPAYGCTHRGSHQRYLSRLGWDEPSGLGYPRSCGIVNVLLSLDSDTVRKARPFSPISISCLACLSMWRCWGSWIGWGTITSSPTATITPYLLWLYSTSGYFSASTI